MKTKQEIVENWLPRYTKHPLEDFTDLVLLTNFNNYVDLFCSHFGIETPSFDANMRVGRVFVVLHRPMNKREKRFVKPFEL